MLRRLLVLSAICLTAALPWRAVAEEQNGLKLTVQKTTLDRNDRRYAYYYTDRIDRIEGLKVLVKNVSFKPLPEGVVEWQILNRKYLSSMIESTSGTEKLQALKPAEEAELIIGAAQIYGWADGTNRYKDKLEWKVVVKHAGKETVKVVTESNFDVIAKRAVQVTPPPQ